MDDKDGREELKIKVLLTILSLPPSSITMEIPFSFSDRIVRELFCSTLYQVMEGIGLALALHPNKMLSGCVTVTAVSLITGGSRGAERINIL